MHKYNILINFNLIDSIHGLAEKESRCTGT
jgi:hypothetical protein